MELTDLHNRRANIALVSSESQLHLAPMLAWPEDKEILKLHDLPLIQGQAPNIPAAWTGVFETETRMVASDSSLREWIKPGRAYYRRMQRTGFAIVTEMALTSYPRGGL